jgi:hypothetical protein
MTLLERFYKTFTFDATQDHCLVIQFKPEYRDAVVTLGYELSDEDELEIRLPDVWYAWMLDGDADTTDLPFEQWLGLKPEWIDEVAMNG